MVVGTRGLELVAASDELLAEGLRVRDDLLGVRLPRGLGRLQERGGNTSDGVVVRAALARGEDGLVDALLEVGSLVAVLAEEDEASTGATEGLVPEARSGCARPITAIENLRRGGDNVAVLEGVRELARSHETRGVRDVGHQERAVLISNSTEGGIVPVTGVRGSTADEKTGLEDA